MDHIDVMSVPLVRVAPTFYKEKTFWETRLTEDEHFRDIGSIDHIDYSPHNDHYDQLLVTSLARISMYDSNSLEVIRTYKTNTQYQVYGGCFRKNDGRLIAVGSEEGRIFIFESHNTNPLRIFDLKAPTHRMVFMDNRLVTFSDDQAVRVIDIGSGTTLKTYGNPVSSNSKRGISDKTLQTTTISSTTTTNPSITGNENLGAFHMDYIRCGCLVDKLIASGSYDNTVKLWDPRCDNLKPVMEYDHGHSVEDFCTRRDTLLISVGGNKLHVYDMIAGKTLTSLIPRHHKTITCVSNYDDKYLLTGALDGYLNILDFNYEYITRFNYEEAQILSLTANPKLLAIGFNNHNVNVKKFKDFIKKSNIEMAELEKIQSGYFGPNMVTRYIHEAIAENQDPVATQRALMVLKQKKTPVALDDVGGLYDSIEIPKFTPARAVKKPYFMKLLRKFMHAEALDHAMRPGKRYNPSDVIYLMQELIKRDKLKVAFAACRRPITLMKFLCAQVSDIRHNRLALDCSLILIDLILSDKSLIQHNNPMFWKALEHFLACVNEELNVINSCVALSAQLNTVIY